MMTPPCLSGLALVRRVLLGCLFLLLVLEDDPVALGLHRLNGGLGVVLPAGEHDLGLALGACTELKMDCARSFSASCPSSSNSLRASSVPRKERTGLDALDMNAPCASVRMLRSLSSDPGSPPHRSRSVSSVASSERIVIATSGTSTVNCSCPSFSGLGPVTFRVRPFAICASRPVGV